MMWDNIIYEFNQDEGWIPIPKGDVGAPAVLDKIHAFLLPHKDYCG